MFGNFGPRIKGGLQYLQQIVSSSGVSHVGPPEVSLTIAAGQKSVGTGTANSMTVRAASSGGTASDASHAITGTGGALNLFAGDGPASVAGTGTGGAVNITAGLGVTGAGATGTGGAVNITGGAGSVGAAISTGGAVLIQGGTGGVNGGSGGKINLTTGVPTSGSGGAGVLELFCGASGSAIGTNVTIRPSQGSVHAGHILLDAGVGAAQATTTTGATVQFPAVAGTPTGVPSTIGTGMVPVKFDSTNKKFYAYIGGAWVSSGLTSPLTTKGDIYTRSSSADARQAIGPDGTTPIADSTQANGWQWADPGNTLITSIQANLAQWRIHINDWLPAANNNGDQIPGGGFTNPGSSNLSETPDFSNAWFSIPKGVMVSATAAASTLFVKSSGSYIAYSATASYAAGFVIRFRAGWKTTQPGCRTFSGIATANSIAGGVEPSTFTNCFGFAADSTDTNLQLMYNDNLGTCTKVDLGVNFPARTDATDFYDMLIWAPVGQATTINYWIQNVTNGRNIATGSISGANMPPTSTLFNCWMWQDIGTTTGSSIRWGQNKIFIMTPW